MKVFHIHFGKDGGAERFFVNLVKGLHARGVEQRVLIRPGRNWKGDLERCATVYEGTFNRVSLSRFFLSAKTNRILREFRPDVVMSWQLRASRFMPNYPAALRVSRLGDYPEHLNYYRRSDVLVCITPDIADRVRALGWKRDVKVIANFTQFGPREAIDRATLTTPCDAFLAVAMGRFVPRKGFDTLLRAIAKTENVYLWLVGDGPERAALERLADNLGIRHRVRFAGWQSDPGAYLAAADVFTITSLHEPLGNVCLEGWGAGKPTISSRAEGPSWVMQDEVDALLVECGDPDALALAFRRLKADPDLRQKLVAGGNDTLRTRFSEEAITRQYIELFGRTATPG